MVMSPPPILYLHGGELHQAFASSAADTQLLKSQEYLTSTYLSVVHVTTVKTTQSSF